MIRASLPDKQGLEQQRYKDETEFCKRYGQQALARCAGDKDADRGLRALLGLLPRDSQCHQSGRPADPRLSAIYPGIMHGVRGSSTSGCATTAARSQPFALSLLACRGGTAVA